MSNGMIKASVMMVIIYALAFWAFGTDINEVQETIIVVEEMTLKQVCKELGRDIKIVKE